MSAKGYAGTASSKGLEMAVADPDLPGGISNKAQTFSVLVCSYA